MALQIDDAAARQRHWSETTHQNKHGGDKGKGWTYKKLILSSVGPNVKNTVHILSGNTETRKQRVAVHTHTCARKASRLPDTWHCFLNRCKKTTAGVSSSSFI